MSYKTLFLNFGFWESTQNYDEACYALARALAQTAEIGEADTVLDAGFGFGGQDLCWASEFRPARIVRLIVTQVAVARAPGRVREAGLLEHFLRPASPPTR